MKFYASFSKKYVYLEIRWIKQKDNTDSKLQTFKFVTFKWLDT